MSSLPDSSSSSTKGVGSGFSCSGWTCSMTGRGWASRQRAQRAPPPGIQETPSPRNAPQQEAHVGRGSLRPWSYSWGPSEKQGGGMHGSQPLPRGCVHGSCGAALPAQARGGAVVAGKVPRSGDRAHYLVHARVEELEGGVPSGAEGALLDELREHLRAQQLAVQLVAGALPRFEEAWGCGAGGGGGGVSRPLGPSGRTAVGAQHQARGALPSVLRPEVPEDRAPGTAWLMGRITPSPGPHRAGPMPVPINTSAEGGNRQRSGAPSLPAAHPETGPPYPARRRGCRHLEPPLRGPG